MKNMKILPVTGAVLLGSFALNHGTPFIPDDVELFNVYENEYTISDYQDDMICFPDKNIHHEPKLLSYADTLNNNYVEIAWNKPVCEKNGKYYQEITTVKCNNLDDYTRIVAIDDFIAHGDVDLTINYLSKYYSADVSTDNFEYKGELSADIMKNSSVDVHEVYPSYYKVLSIRKQTFEEDFYDTMLYGAYMFFGYKLGEILEGLLSKSKKLIKK